jgi:WD40 repeat protein
MFCSRCGFYVSAGEGTELCPNCKQRNMEVVPKGTACIRSISIKGQQVVAGTSRGELALIVLGSGSASAGEPGATKELRMLLSSHGKSAVSVIEFHPSEPSLFFTVGDDCLLRMWNLEEKRLLLCIRLASVLMREDGTVATDVTATGLHISRDGRFVAVGFSKGQLALVDCVTSERRLLLKKVSDDDFRILRRGGEGVSCLRFGASNNRILLAAGMCDGLIHVFQDDDTGMYFNFATTCKGHSGKILSIDWSLDGKHMQSTSADYQLLYWHLETFRTDPKDIPESVSFAERDRMLRPRLRCKPQRPIKCCDVQWAEWTSSLGWWVQGSRNIAPDENAIVSTHAQNKSPTLNLCVFGDVEGQVSLFPFPCSEKSPILAQARVQSGPMRCVRLSAGEHEFLLGSSESGGGLFTWRIEANGKEDLAKMGTGGTDSDPCWKLIMHRLTEVHSTGASGEEKKAPPSSQADDNFLASVHPYLSAIRPPLGWRPSSEAFSAPDNELKLEYVFGYRGLDCARNLLKIKNQELLYYVASVCVVFNPQDQRRTQRIFDKHRSDIECVALSSDRITIASVSAGIRPKAQVWNSKSLKVLGHVDSLHEGKLCAMCFSGDGKVLALAVTNGKTCSVAFYDWHHNTLLAEHTAQPWTILAIECNPVTGTFVTAGVRHVHFWRLMGRNLTLQMGLVEQHQTMTSIAFLGDDDRVNTIVIGNITGDLLMWKEDKDAIGSVAPDQIVKKAHSGGPVFDMKNDDGRLVTCSKGGHVIIWKHEGRCTISKEHDLFITLPPESADCACCEKTARDKLACIRSVVRIKKLNMGTHSLVIGTGNNSIYEVYIDATSTTLQAEVIMPSHAEGKIMGLVPHPGKAIFASCGEDRSIKVWDREERIILRERSLPHEPSALAYSLDGSRLVVGTNTGKILILNASTLEEVAAVDRPATRKVRDLKFSPDGRLLAAASEDAIIYVYAIPLTRQYITGEFAREPAAKDTFQLVGMCKGHARGVVRLDWSSDGAQMQSESDDYDTILWDVSVCKNQRYAPMRNAQSHVNVPWQTRDCILTWHTFGLLHPVADFNTFLTSARSKLGDALAVGDCNGGLRLYRFPCPSKESRFRQYSGHSIGVCKVCFSYEDRHVMSAGCRDQAIFVWHHLIIPGPEETDALIEEMIRSKKHDHAAAAAARVQQIELDSVPAYLNSIVTPTSWNAEEARLLGAPDFDFTMEYIYGFRGAGRNQSICRVGENQILYLAAMVIVMMDLTSRNQRFFRKHEHDVTCYALHPNGEIVASADCGQSGKILVWSVSDMSILSTVSTIPKQSVCSLCFSQDASFIFCVMDNHENTVLTLEWEANQKVAIEKGGPNQVLAMAAHPDGKVLVTCGYKHIRFWTVEKGQMYSTSGSFGAGKPQTMICIAFTHEDQEVQPLTLSGAQNGCIYMWQEHYLQRIVVAHSSPILDICLTDDGVITGGIDGLVRLWSEDWTSCARLDVAELTRGLQGYSSGVITPVKSIVMLEDNEEQNEIRRLVVGMETNEIYLFKFDGHPEDVDVPPETQILVQGHANGSLCQVSAHPSLQEFATIGHDKTLRTWDCEQVSPINFVRLPDLGTALAYFPDGQSLVAGLSNGSVLRVNAESGEIETILEKRTKIVTRVKFSPSGKMLAVGYESGTIDVLDVGAVCVLIFSCKANGSIEQVDFSTDEKVLQCSTAAMELTFWNLSNERGSAGKPIHRPAEFRDKTWETWSSRFGFAVQALSPIVNQITSVQRANSPLLLAGLSSGRFEAYGYPAIGESLEGKSFHGHLAPLADLCFTQGDQRLISVGLTDCSIVQWKVSLAGGRWVVDADGRRAWMPDKSGSEFDSEVASSEANKHRVKTRILYFFLDYVFDEWDGKLEDVFISKLAKFDDLLSKDAIHVLEVLPGSVILKVQISAPRLTKIVNQLEADHRNPAGLLRKNLKVAHLIADEDIFWLAYHPKAGAPHLSRVPKIEALTDLSQDPDLLKPYVSTSIQPNIKVNKEHLKMPVEYVELEHVHGFAGFDRIGNLFYVKTGEVLYTVGSVAILHDHATGRQSFFRKHCDEIVAVTLHKNGELVATADNGASSTVFVWSSVTMEALMRLSSNPAGCVVAMCFSSDAEKLIVVSEVVDAMVQVFDW